MLKFLVPVLFVFCGSVWALSPQDAAAPGATAKPTVSPEETAVNEILKVYVDVYNKHDAAALIEYWAPNAVSTSTETGARITGRDAIKAAFEQHFKSNPQCKLTVRLKHFRFVKPEILNIEGETVMTSPNHEPGENLFTALLVKVGEKWQIEHASESPIPTPATPYDGLKSLEWLVGNWVDDTKEVSVESNITWNQKKTFLIRKFSVQFAGETEAETGTQIIAWDARSKSIRSWTFSSDGSFGEGTWSNTDNEWRVKFNHSSVDGSLITGTQVITKVDDQTANVQLVGHEVDGEMAPTKPAIKMIKKSAATTEEPKK